MTRLQQTGTKKKHTQQTLAESFSKYLTTGKAKDGNYTARDMVPVKAVEKDGFKQFLKDARYTLPGRKYFR